MAKPRAAFIAVLAFCLTSAFSSTAAPVPPSKTGSASEGRYSLTPSYGGIYYSATGPKLFAPLYGLKLGYDNDGKSILDNFGTELTLNMYDGKAKDGEGEVSGYLLRIEEVLPFTLKKKLVPYAAVGIGGIVSISEEITRVLPFFTYGPGIKYYFNDNLLLRADARQILTVAINGIENFEISAGLTYRFDTSRKEKPVPKVETTESDKEQKPDEKTARDQKENEQKEREQREKERLEREQAEREQRAQEWKKWEAQKKAQLQKEMEEYEEELKRPAVAVTESSAAPPLALSTPELAVAPPLPVSGEKEAVSALPQAAGSAVASETAPSAAVPTPAAPAPPEEPPVPTPVEAQAAPSEMPAGAVPAMALPALPAVAGALPAAKEAVPSAQPPAAEVKAGPALPAEEVVKSPPPAAAAASEQAAAVTGSIPKAEEARPAAAPLSAPAPVQPAPETTSAPPSGEAAAKPAPRTAEPSPPETATPESAALPAPAPVEAHAVPTGAPTETVPAMVAPALPAIAGALSIAGEAVPTAQPPAAGIKAGPALPAVEAVTPPSTAAAAASKQAEAAAESIIEAEAAKPAAAPLPAPAPAQPAPAAGEAAAIPALRIVEPSSPEAATPGVVPAPAPAEAQAAAPEKPAEPVTVQIAPAPPAPPATTVVRETEPATPALPAEAEAPPAATTAPEAAVPAVLPAVKVEAEPAAASGDAPKPAELPAERQLPPSSPAAGAAEEGALYTLSAGETISRKKHETLLKRLTTAGQHPVGQKEVREIDVYRLVSECRDDKDAAKKLRDRLAHKIGDAFVTRDGDAFCVVAGSFLSEEDAQKGQQQLARKNLALKVVKSRVSVPVWSITSGTYGDVREAEAAAGRLANQGIAAAVTKVDPGMARPAAKRVVRELTIEFDFDKQEIKPEYHQQLREMADFLKSSNRISARIEGHTDGIGGDAYNFRLSNRRARSLKQALVKLGAPPARISVEGFGKTRPVADNTTDEGRKKNRRAVTIILTSD